MTQSIVEDIDSISVEKWLALTEAFKEDGSQIPLYFCVTGTSMLPLLRSGRDRVTVFPINGRLRRGDIVLFRHKMGHINYIIHRVYKLDGDRVMTYGDGNQKPDCWIPMSDMIGIAVEIKRNNRIIKPQSFLWMTYGKIWMFLRPLRPILRTLINVLGRVKGKIKERK